MTTAADPLDDGRVRCPWSTGDPLLAEYHDTVWGVPEHDDRALFAKLVLDGAQAGLSWLTILRKRDGYLRAFDGLDPSVVATYDEVDVERLLADPGIVRNRAKVRSAIRNARAFLDVQREHGSFDAFLWGFVDGRPIRNEHATQAALPAETELSRTISKALKNRGFNFVGPTIVYAFMQAIGMVNDHLTSCFRHHEV